MPSVAVESIPHSRVRIRVEVPAADVAPHLKRAARELARERPPKGFRPGAAPLVVLRRVLGDAPILARAAHAVVRESYPEVLVGRPEVETIGRPDVTVERCSFDGPCVYAVETAVLPKVTLGAYRAVRAAKREVSSSPEEVARELAVLQKMRAQYRPVARAAARGDRVSADLRLTVEGVPLADGPRTPQVLVLGEGGLLPGFEEQLVGLKTGEARTFTLRVPPQHYRADLRGRVLACSVDVRAVEECLLPPLDDAFARVVGSFGSLAELREHLRANLQAEKETKETERFEQALLDAVVAGSTFGELPEVLVERELDTMIAELRAGTADLGLPFETYLQQIKKDLPTLRDGLRPRALARIRASLTLRALARAEGITASAAEVEEETTALLARFTDPAEARRMLELESLREQAAAAVRNRKVFARLAAIAAGEAAAGA